MLACSTIRMQWEDLFSGCMALLIGLLRSHWEPSFVRAFTSVKLTVLIFNNRLPSVSHSIATSDTGGIG